MSEITARDVMKLRKATGAGAMDAKRALAEAGGDFAAAQELLRTQGLADAKKRAGRASNQGTIGHYLHYQADRPVIGVLVELRSETDFVAKTEEFQQAARQLAMHIAAARPRYVAVEDVPKDVLDKEAELITAQARHEGKPDTVIPRIVEGRLKSFYEDNVLYEQTFVNAEVFEGTVGAMVEGLAARLGENVSVGTFARVAVGEGSE